VLSEYLLGAGHDRGGRKAIKLGESFWNEWSGETGGTLGYGGKLWR